MMGRGASLRCALALVCAAGLLVPVASCKRKAQQRKLPSVQVEVKPKPLQVLSLAAAASSTVLVGLEPRLEPFASGLIRARTRGVHRLGPDRSLAALDAGLGPEPVHALAVTPKGVYLAAVGGAVMRSLDAGKSWEAGDESSKFAAQALLVLADGRVFAGTRDAGVKASGDGGQHWGATGLSKGAVFALAQHPNGRVFAGTAEGVWEWEWERGGDWVLAGFPEARVKAVAVDARGVVYAATAGIEPAKLEAMPTQKAAEAIAQGTGVYASEIEAAAPGRGAQPGRVAALASGPRQPFHRSVAAAYAAGAGDAGTDGGAVRVWTMLGLKDQTTWALLALPDGTLLAGTRAQGVQRRAAGEARFEAVAGMQPGMMVTSLLQTGTSVHAGTEAGVYGSTDGGKTWAQETPGL